MSQGQTIDWSQYAAPSQQAQAPQIDFTKYEGVTAPAPTPKKTWLDQATDFGKELWNQVNPVSGVQGAAQLTSHPIKTYMADADNRQKIMNDAEAAFKKGDYAGGMAKALYSIVPFIGPQLESSADKLASGDVGAGLGQATGLGLNLAVPEALKNANIPLPGSNAAGALARSTYERALKPSTTLTTGQVSKLVNTGLENGIPVSEAGIGKINDLVSDLNDKVQAQIKAGSNAGATVNKFAVTSRLGPTAQRFATQVNPEADLNAVGNAGNEFLANQPNQIPAAQAQAIKSGTYQQLGSKAYGELSTASAEAQKALARGIKEELQTQFPEIQGLNAKESELIGLQPVIERAVRRISNRNLIGLGDMLTGGAGLATGGGIGAVTATVLHRIVTDPTLQTKLAIALNHASRGGITIGEAQARIAGYTNALGNAAVAPSSPDDTQGPQ